VRIAYLGNFSVPYCTEVHVAASLEALGHQVTRIQEGQVRTAVVPRMSERHDCFLWTQTYSLAERGGTRSERHRMLEQIRKTMPTVGFHLDRWWGLGREHQIQEEPFFRVDYLFTADGGHQDEWERAGVNHLWSPPAVYHAEAVDVDPDPRLDVDVVFVGAWREYGHKEWWPYRQELITRLEGRYGDRFTCWPRAGEPAVRGLDLNRLYASAKVVVGDSCLAGAAHCYFSDRVPETLGRGGFLIHPQVKGLGVIHPELPTYPLGDWNALFDLIDWYIANPAQREELRRRLASDVRANHTYMNRMQYVIGVIGGADAARYLCAH